MDINYRSVLKVKKSNFKPTLNGGAHLRLVSPKLLNGVVRGDNQSTVLKINLASFCLSCTCIAVRPDLEVVAETYTPLIKIVEDDSMLSGVVVKPLVLRLEIRSWEVGSGCMGLACLRLSVVPETSDSGMIIGVFQGSEDIDSTVHLGDLVQGDKSFIHGSSESLLQNVLVLLSSLGLSTLHVYRSDEVPVLLHVLLDCLPRLGDLIVAMVFRKVEPVSCPPTLLLELDEGVDVRCAVLVLLLGDDIFGDVMFFFQIL